MFLQCVKEKHSARLSVRVTGTPQPEVTWYLNDVEVTPTLKVSLQQRGELHTLELSQARPAMAGDYTVVVVNPAGRVQHTASLAVTGKPPSRLKPDQPPRPG